MSYDPNQPRNESGEWTSEGGTSAGNLNKALDIYEGIAEKSVPGKGAAARQIISSGIDSEAHRFADPGRLEAMKYRVDQQFAMNLAKGIVQRQPHLNEQLKKLKG